MKRIVFILLVFAACSEKEKDVRSIDKFSAVKGAEIYKFTLTDLKLKDPAFDPFNASQAKVDSAFEANYRMMTGQK